MDRGLKEFHLPSNNGRNRLYGKVNSAHLSDKSGIIIVEIALTGIHWNRVDPLKTGIDLMPDTSLIINQLLLHRTGVMELLQLLQKWFACFEPFRVELVQAGDQSFVIAVGPSKRLITTQSKPACMIRYRSSAITYRNSFVVDQTCLSTLHDSLSKAILAAEDN